jgi:hypothetical protein
VNAIKVAMAAATAVLCAACGPSGAAPSPPAPPCPPRLTILSPVSGETTRAPLRVRLRVDCFRVGPDPGGHIHAWAGPPGASRRYELWPRRQSGVLEVELPDPLLSGERTLTFQLARADHSAVANPEAKVVVTGVVFEGP